MRQVNDQTFYAEAEQRFGTDRMGWRFVCPKCGLTQSANDFVAAKIEKEDIKKYIGIVCLASVKKPATCDCDVRTLKEPELIAKLVEVKRGNGMLYNYFELASVPVDKPEEQKPNNKTERKNENMAKKKQQQSKKLTDAEKKEAARQRAKAWRDAHKQEAKPKSKSKNKLQREEVVVRPPNIQTPPPAASTRPPTARVRARRKAQEILILLAEPDKLPIVQPGAVDIRKVSAALAHIREHCAPGTYKVAIVKATRTLNVETKEIRELK